MRRRTHHDDDLYLDPILGEVADHDVGTRTTVQRITRAPRVTEWPEDSYTGVPDLMARATFAKLDAPLLRQRAREAEQQRRERLRAEGRVIEQEQRKQRAKVRAVRDAQLRQRVAAELRAERAQQRAQPTKRKRTRPVWHRVPSWYREPTPEEVRAEQERAARAAEKLEGRALVEAWRKRKEQRG